MFDVVGQDMSRTIRLLDASSYRSSDGFFKLKARDLAWLLEESPKNATPIVQNDKATVLLMFMLDFARCEGYRLSVRLNDFCVTDGHRGLLATQPRFFSLDGDEGVEWVESKGQLVYKLTHASKPALEVRAPAFFGSRIPIRLRGAASEVCQILVDRISDICDTAWWLKRDFELMVHEQYVQHNRVKQRMGGVKSLGSYNEKDLLEDALGLSPAHVLYEGNGVHSLHLAGVRAVSGNAKWNYEDRLASDWCGNEDEEAFCLHMFVSIHYLLIFMNGKEAFLHERIKKI